MCIERVVNYGGAGHEKMNNSTCANNFIVADKINGRWVVD